MSRPRGHSAAGMIMSMKNSNDTIGNPTCDLLACNTVPPRDLNHNAFYTNLKPLLRWIYIECIIIIIIIKQFTNVSIFITLHDNHNISKQGVKQKEYVFHLTHESFLDKHCQSCFDCNYELPPGMRIRNLLRNVLRTNYTEVYFISSRHIL
jgi:hypothetical protein